MRTIEEVVDEINHIETDDINGRRATAIAELLDEILEIHKAEQMEREYLSIYLKTLKRILRSYK